jgi:hypothetical protein
MNRNNCFSALMAIIAILLPVTLTSCQDDDDPAVDDRQAAVNIKVTYSIDLAGSWYEFYNVEMTYTSPGGNPKTETAATDQVESMTLPMIEAPDSVALTVIAKPKADHPEVIDGKVYSLDHSANLRVVILTESGKDSIVLFSQPNDAKLSSGGDAFRNALQKERRLYNRSYTIKR